MDIRNKNEGTQKHGEENVQVKPHGLCTQMSGSNLT